MTKKDIQGFDISEKMVAVIGCGGLGCNIAVHLAGSGAGKIYLCDFDTVSGSNLNRQFLYTAEDIGRLKTEAAAERLSAYAKDVRICRIDRKITFSSDLDFAKDCDVIFLAVDNNEARKAAASFCTENKIPLVNGGINGFFGTAYLYVPQRTPCPECAGIFQSENQRILSVSTSAAIIGALEAQLGIEYMLSPGTAPAGELYIYDAGVITKLKIKGNPECKICNNCER